MNELKKCPFCGEAERLRMNGNNANSWVECRSCEARGPLFCPEGEALDLWNRRHEEKTDDE